MARKRKNGEGSWGTKTIKGKVYRYFRDADGKYFYGNTDKEIKQKIRNAFQSESVKSINKEQLFGDYVLTWLENMKSGIDRLRQNEQIVKEREADRGYRARQKDKGAR